MKLLFNQTKIEPMNTPIPPPFDADNQQALRVSDATETLQRIRSSVVEACVHIPCVAEYIATLERRAEVAESLKKGWEHRAILNDPLRESIAWFEGYFTMHVDGGGNHACPWCYAHSEDNNGNPSSWSNIKHAPLCPIGRALAPIASIPHS